MPEIAIIVPARMESIRFPRKLLHTVWGKPLLLCVAERIAEQAPQWPLYFAVDHEELADVVRGSGFEAIMTSSTHASGTDRLVEANEKIGADLVINVQGDEPLVSGAQIRALAEGINADVPMATLCTQFWTKEDFVDPNQVKVVRGNDGCALYFSRAPIPYPRDSWDELDPDWFTKNKTFRHLGLYAYRREFLAEWKHLAPGRLEQLERLEQLRALENGYRISVGVSDDPSIGIDTLEDLEKLSRHVL
ncbi:MAG: 3-deoxy-manno-octulosonate cytidylyltransferase [Opitutales bacterium]